VDGLYGDLGFLCHPWLPEEYKISVGAERGAVVTGGLENESKHRVPDEAVLRRALAALGFGPDPGVDRQVDEYYDSPDGSLRRADVVCRVRVHDGRAEAGFKGPRRWHDDGSHVRVEVELPVADVDEVRAALARQGLVLVWRLEKRRRVFRRPPGDLVVCLDELPGLGLFVELEGPVAALAEVREALGAAIGAAEPRNYHEIATADHPDLNGLLFD
jgi:adenylate cyclase class 2